MLPGVTPPLDLVMRPLMHYLMQDHVMTPRRSLGPLWSCCLEVSLLNMCDPLHMIFSGENRDLSVLDICPIETTFLFLSFSLEVLETTIPLDYSALLNKLCTVLARECT